MVATFVCSQVGAATWYGINFPAPRGGVFAASHHSSLRSPIPKSAASGGELTRSDLTKYQPTRICITLIAILS